MALEAMHVGSNPTGATKINIKEKQMIKMCPTLR